MSGPDPEKNFFPMGMGVPMDDTEFTNKVAHLRREFALQQELLLMNFQQQQQQLALRQDRQLAQVQIMAVAAAAQQQQQQQQIEDSCLEQLRNKEEKQQSAVASTAVKERLKQCVLNKLQKCHSTGSQPFPPDYRRLSSQHSQNSFEAPHNPPISQLKASVSLDVPMDDSNLRRAASEPNLKVRSVLKKKVMERRTGPMSSHTRRKQLLCKEFSQSLGRYGQHELEPPLPTSPSLSRGATRQSSGEDSLCGDTSPMPYDCSKVKDVGYLCTTSVPSITIGRPPSTGSAHQLNEDSLSSVGNQQGDHVDSEVVQPSLLQPTFPISAVPYYAFLGTPGDFVCGSKLSPLSALVASGSVGDPVTAAAAAAAAATIASAATAPTAAYNHINYDGYGIEEDAAGLTQQQRPQSSEFRALSVFTDQQVAQARLNRQSKPIARTHSAPLPHLPPFSAAASSGVGPVGAGNMAADMGLSSGGAPSTVSRSNTAVSQASSSGDQESQVFLRKIRKTVLRRANAIIEVDCERGDENGATYAPVSPEISDASTCKTTGTSATADAAMGNVKDRLLVLHLDSSSESQPGSELEELKRLQLEVSDSNNNNANSTQHLTVPTTSDAASASGHHIKAIGRAHSSPVVSYNTPPQIQISPRTTPSNCTTGIAYDPLMLRHTCLCGDDERHPERAGRLSAVWEHLDAAGITRSCQKVKGRKVTPDELQLCHTESYVSIYGCPALIRCKMDPSLISEAQSRFCVLPCGGIGLDSDTVWNDLNTPHAARMAVGCAAELGFKIASDEIKNGFALIRPPGHHAEPDQPLGFCLFNGIAITAKLLRQRFQYDRILIVDWDVHHGNGTQQMFYDDPHILYLSLHRHDNGNFFPGTGAPEDCGTSAGLGFTVNIAWQGSLCPPMADAEYMAAFRSIVMPIGREFDPQIVLVSAGFDAAAGHTTALGGYSVSPQGFGFMTTQLMQLANGKLLLLLEGGYDIDSLCYCTEACLRSLLDMDGNSAAEVGETEMARQPCEIAISTLKYIIEVQSQYWSCLRGGNGAASVRPLVGLSENEARHVQQQHDTLSATDSLSVRARKQYSTGSSGYSSTESELQDQMCENGNGHSPAATTSLNVMSSANKLPVQISHEAMDQS